MRRFPRAQCLLVLAQCFLVWLTTSGHQLACMQVRMCTAPNSCHVSVSACPGTVGPAGSPLETLNQSVVFTGVSAFGCEFISDATKTG